MIYDYVNHAFYNRKKSFLMCSAQVNITWVDSFVEKLGVPAVPILAAAVAAAPRLVALPSLFSSAWLPVSSPRLASFLVFFPVFVFLVSPRSAPCSQSALPCHPLSQSLCLLRSFRSWLLLFSRSAGSPFWKLLPPWRLLLCFAVPFPIRSGWLLPLCLSMRPLLVCICGSLRSSSMVYPARLLQSTKAQHQLEAPALASRAPRKP